MVISQTFLHWNLTLSTRLPQRTSYLLLRIWLRLHLYSKLHEHPKCNYKNATDQKGRFKSITKIYSPCNLEAAATVKVGTTTTVATAAVELVNERARADVTVFAVFSHDDMAHSMVSLLYICLKDAWQHVFVCGINPGMTG